MVADVSEVIMLLLCFMQIGNHAEQSAWDGCTSTEILSKSKKISFGKEGKWERHFIVQLQQKTLEVLVF